MPARIVKKRKKGGGRKKRRERNRAVYNRFQVFYALFYKPIYAFTFLISFYVLLQTHWTCWMGSKYRV